MSRESIYEVENLQSRGKLYQIDSGVRGKSTFGVRGVIVNGARNERSEEFRHVSLRGSASDRGNLIGVDCYVASSSQ
jgi:hypothetical protein